MTLRRLEQVNGCLFIAVTHSNRLLVFLLVSFHPAFYNFFVYFLLFSRLISTCAPKTTRQHSRCSDFGQHVERALAGGKPRIHSSHLQGDALVDSAPTAHQLRSGPITAQTNGNKLIIARAFTFNASIAAASCSSRPAAKLPSNRCATPLLSETG